MKIERVKFKDVEGVRVSTKSLEAIYLPQYGGKLVSLKDTDSKQEWLAQDKNEKYIPQTIDGSYIESEVSAADEMFPTIDPCVKNGLEYPCHGEVCRVAHREKIEPDALEMEYQSQELGYIYTKKVTCDEGDGLIVKYTIENKNSFDFPCLWALHLMFDAQEGGKIIGGFEDNDKVEIIFDDRNHFGKKGDILPISDRLLTSGEYRESGDAYKYYILNSLKEGYCGYYREDIKKGIKLSYDKNILPYLGVWINDGGFKDMHSAAGEPCNLPYDSPENAEKRGFGFILKPEEKLEFVIKFEIISKER